MALYNLIATSAFGIESVVSRELKGMGYSDLVVENGRVLFTGDQYDMLRSNMWLRTADRVLWLVAEFKATDFEELFQGVKQVRWEEFIPENAVMHVTGKSVKSKLFSVSDCQAITKKAIIEAMKRKYKNETFPEDGPLYKIQVAILNDVVTLSIDTSGDGLHKRGYRQDAGEAPLRETLAATMILLSRWNHTRVLADPFCGSATIPIEAALIGRNIAPGINRNFTCETWPGFPKKMLKTVREEARDAGNTNQLSILASDINKKVFDQAKINAGIAGVGDAIDFQKKPVAEFSSKRNYGCIITNPPYGERLKQHEIKELYKTMGEVFLKLDTWSHFILTSYPDFQKCFGKKPDKNRKLYNGKLKTYLYQYFGPLPPRK